MTEDLRAALRSLVLSRGYALVVILTLALGIGANAALFSVVHGVLLEPLPYPQSDRLMQVWEHNQDGNQRNVINPGNFKDWQARATGFSGLVLYANTSLVLTGGEQAERITGQAATVNLFDVLGVQPVLGRGFRAEDAQLSEGRRLVISDGLWRRRFGADPGVIGRTVPIAGNTAEIMGVMPRGFRPLAGEEFWEPVYDSQGVWQRRGRFAYAIGRLKDGVSVEQAGAEMRAIGDALAREYPEFNTGWTVNAQPLLEDLVGQARRTLLVLMGAVGFVLLIACANVGNLLLTRAAARGREVAVRAALGASPARLLRAWCAEVGLLVLIGSLAGLGLAAAAVRALLALAPPGVPRLEAISLDPAVLMVSAGIAVLVTLVLGLATAGSAVRVPLAGLRSGDRRSTGDAQARRFRSGLVVAQVAGAVVLAIGAGLMLRTLDRLFAVDPGFEPAAVLTAEVTLPYRLYPEPARQDQFYAELQARLAAVPGVESQGMVSVLPFGGLGSATSFHSLDRPVPAPGDEPGADIRVADPGYFASLRIPLHAGRMFDSRDAADAPHAVLVNETLAREMWPDQSAIGQRLKVSWHDPEAVATVVGVVGDTLHRGLDAAARGTIYYPFAQSPVGSRSLVLRSRTAAGPLGEQLRRVVATLDPQVPVRNIGPLEEVVVRAAGPRRYVLMLLGLLATLAITLAAIGLYGVLAHGVASRTREIGVRVALGALPAQVVRMVTREGVGLVGLGIGLGAVVAATLAPVLASLLFGVAPHDLLTFVVVTVVLVGTALAASAVPAWRATRVDPIEALRHE